MQNDKITLVTNDYSGPAIPEQFERNLRAYDPTLLVRWNYKKMRFVIEQCVEHHGPAEHNHLCARIYVLLCQDPEGCMMSLGDAVMNMLRVRDVSKAGYGPNDLKQWIGDANAKDEAVRAGIEKKQAEAVKHASSYGRRQLIRAFNELANCGTPNR